MTALTDTVLIDSLGARFDDPDCPASTVRRLSASDDTAALQPEFERLMRIEVSFPALADGRGFSQAAQLRRLGYTGELRAVGPLLVDHLFMLRRVGFDTFTLRADQPLATARAALARYDVVYQTAADRAVPAWRLRGAPAQSTARE